ncbi:MAG: beta-lactamase family protein [Alphaproteobacteria bacterium]|nr:beta-lactamase family protein [Alphaproteobacteria bacterium]
MSSFASHPSLAGFADHTAEPARLGFDRDRLTRIGHWMDRYVEAGKLPYAMTLIARGGAIAYLDARGSTEPKTGEAPAVDHLARIYSMTKPIVTAAAMTFYEEGRFQLEDPIARWLPEFGDPRIYVEGRGEAMKTRPAEGPITIRQLMTHTAGLTYGFFDPGPIGEVYRQANVDFSNSPETLAVVAKRAAAVPLCFEPGTRWTYSIATDILGRLVEVIAGQSLEQVLRERVLDPLGMVDTAFGAPEAKAERFAACFEKTADGGMQRTDDRTSSKFLGRSAMHSGGGGLVSTLPDYLRFTEAMRRGGALGDARILGRKTVELMMLNHLPGDLASMGQAAFSEMPMVGIGFGLGGSILIDPARAQIPGSAGEFAWGGVASTGFWIDRAEELSVIFLTQLMPSSAWPIRRELRVLTYQALVD